MPKVLLKHTCNVEGCKGLPGELVNAPDSLLKVWKEGTDYVLWTDVSDDAKGEAETAAKAKKAVAAKEAADEKAADEKKG